MPSSENWMRGSITTSASANADELNGCVGRSGILVRGGSPECPRVVRMQRGSSPDLHSVGQRILEGRDEPIRREDAPSRKCRSRASRTAARTPSDSAFSVPMLNSRTLLLLRHQAGRNTSAFGSGRRQPPSGCGAVSLPRRVSNAPLASASALNIDTLTDRANPRKFTLGPDH
jgi:hypothetical protein